MDVGTLGGIIGGILGVTGGAIGTYVSIKNTNGPRERRFMIRAAALIWVALALFLTLLLALPKPYNYLMWIAYGIGFPLGVMGFNRKHANLRAIKGSR